MTDEALLDPEAFPYLAAFVPGYLHQDLGVCGGVQGAVAAWRGDTSAAETEALAAEWTRFLALTPDLDTAARARMLEDSFGGAWAPRSARELDELTAALRTLAES